MYSESETQQPETAPECRGRVQFEQETGARHVDEEFAAELAPRAAVHTPQEAEPRRSGEAEADGPLDAIGTFVAEEGETVARNKSLGIVALVLAAISLFFLPSVLGPAAVVVGFAAYIRGDRLIGLWSMALGLLAAVAYFVLAPYYT